jgi:hypothetical protein
VKTIDVQPSSLSAAVAPLREAASALNLVVDHRRDVLSLLDGSAVVRSALERFLSAWELVGFGVAEDAAGLAVFLEWSAQRYVGVDRSVMVADHVGH